MTDLPDSYDSFYQARDLGCLDAFTPDDPEIATADDVTWPDTQDS